MRIILSPQRRDELLSASVIGEAISINGEWFDLGGVTEGHFLPSGAFSSNLLHEARREGGLLTVTVILPHGPNPSESVAFPAPIDVGEDGDVVIQGGGNV